MMRYNYSLLEWPKKKKKCRQYQVTAVGGGQGEDVDWPVTWTQEIRGSSPLPPSWHVNSAYCSRSGSCSKDITLREWGGPEAIWMVQWWNPIKASVQTFKVLTDGHGDVFIKGPSKTTLVSKCSCGLNPPPTTPTTWSDLPLFHLSSPLCVWGPVSDFTQKLPQLWTNGGEDTELLELTCCCWD